MLELLDILELLGVWCVGYAAKSHVDQLKQLNLKQPTGSIGSEDEGSQRHIQRALTFMQQVICECGVKRVLISDLI